MKKALDFRLWAILLISVLCPLLSESADRLIDQSWDASLGFSKLMDVQFGQAESLSYTHRARWGSAPIIFTNADQVLVWEVMGKAGTANYTNAYIVSTGAVQSASGVVRFTVAPSNSNIQAGQYSGYVRSLRQAGSNLEHVAVLAYQDITVKWTPDSRFYAVRGPFTQPVYYTTNLLTVVGPQGPQGPAGSNGVDGATGPMGPQGPAGTNDVDRIIALENRPVSDTNLAEIVTQATNDLAEAQSSIVNLQSSISTGVVYRVDLDGSAYFPDWFQWSISKVSDAVADSSSVFTNMDRVIRRDVFNATAADYLFSFSSFYGVDQFSLSLSTSDSGVATASVHQAYYVGDGTADVTASLGLFSRTTNLVFSASGVTQDVTLAAVTGTVLNALFHGIDDLLLPGTTTDVYSVQNHATTNYVRNTNCWAAGLDLTCASPWNSYGGTQRAGALITSNIIVTASHFALPVGTTVRFVTSSNTVISRSVVSNVSLFTRPNYSDIMVSKLSSPISESEVRRAALMPDDLFSYFITETIKTPGFYVDQLEKALVEEASIFEQRDFTFVPSTVTNRTGYTYPGIRVFDSSSPIFFNLHGYDRPVLIGVVQGLGHTFFGGDTQGLILSAAAAMGGSTNVVRPDFDALGFTNFMPPPPMPGN